MSKKLEKEIEELKKRIAELESNKTKAAELPFWMPKPGGKYYYTDFETDGDTGWHDYAADNVDKNHLAMGNYFETEKLAQRHVDKLMLLEEIKQWRGKHDPDSFKLDWDNSQVCKMELVYECTNSNWEFIDVYSTYTPLAIYLSEDAPTGEFLEHFGDRLDLLLERDGE